MHTALSSLLAATLFIHAVFGCCWHRAAECVQCEIPVAEAACCEHHHHHDESPEAPPAHRPDGPCECRLECPVHSGYLPIKKMEVDCTLAVAPLDGVLVMPSGLVAASTWESSWFTLEPKPPERLHLLHQVFLI